MNRYEAWVIARRYMKGFQPPITCGHAWSRWYGLILHWRYCSDCRMVEGTLGVGRQNVRPLSGQ